MISGILAATIVAIAPARKKLLPPPIKLIPADDLGWKEFATSAPLMDAEDFTRWCEEIGETGDNPKLGRVALHNLATEYCCQVKLGAVQPPRIDKLFTHLKPSGWQHYRLPPQIVGNKQHRPYFYRINPYQKAKS